LLAEYFVPRRKEAADESLAAFARRRLGREAFERIVQPLVGGIYAADPERLSVQATMPRFVEMERRYGSLIRGAQAAAQHEAEESGARYGLFVAPRAGLSSLVETLAAKLPPDAIRLESPVKCIARGANQMWTLAVAPPGREAEEITADAVVVAVPAPAAAAMLAQLDKELSNELARIEYAGTSIVSLALRRDQVARPLDAFGFVVPVREKRRILAASFASVKFPDRAPDDVILVRVFIGGACQRELADLGDDALRQVAADELHELIGTRGRPQFLDVARWPGSMPQYHVGHCDLVASIERKVGQCRGLALAGNAYHGVGIPACIHSGEAAAERIVEQLKESRTA
jgi:oxygen-dependent protoporphyrinogen oxidase